MKAFTEDGTLFLVPETDLVASRVEEMRTFFMNQLKSFPEERVVVLDASGIDIVDSLGVNLIIGLYKHTASELKAFRIVNAEEKFLKVANFFRFASIFPVESR